MTTAKHLTLDNETKRIGRLNVAKARYLLQATTSSELTSHDTSISESLS
jgi:hypothetical protein